MPRVEGEKSPNKDSQGNEGGGKKTQNFNINICIFLKSWLRARGWVLDFPKPDKGQSDVQLPDPVGADPKEGE